MASDIFLYRKDRRWQKFSKIDEIVLTGAQTVYPSVTGVNSTDVLTIANNTLSNGDAVYFTSLTGSSLTVNTTYYVVNKSGNTFQLASVVGGSALNLGSDITAGTIVQTQPDMNVWSGEYRDLFDVETLLHSAPVSLTIPTGLATTNVSAERLQYKAALIPTEPFTQETVSELYSNVGLVTSTTQKGVVPADVNLSTSDEVSHTPLRQSILKRTHWRFRQANGVTPTYLYATWADGDQISNSPPETE